MKFILILHLVLVTLSIQVLGSHRNDSSKPILKELSISGEYSNLSNEKPDVDLDSFMKVLANVTPEFYKLLSKHPEEEAQKSEKQESDSSIQINDAILTEEKMVSKKSPKFPLRKNKISSTTTTVKPDTTTVKSDIDMEFDEITKTELSPKIFSSFLDFLKKQPTANTTTRNPHRKIKRDTNAVEYADSQMDNAEDLLQKLYQRVESSKTKKVQLPSDKKSLVSALGQLVGDFEKLVGSEEMTLPPPEPPREKKFVSFDIQVFSKANSSSTNSTNKRVRKSNSDAKVTADVTKRQSDDDDDDSDDDGETESPVVKDRQKKDEEVVIDNEISANETDKNGETSIQIKDTIKDTIQEDLPTTTTALPAKKEIASMISVMRNLSESLLHDLDILSADTEKVMTTVPTTTVWIETSWDINVRINDSMLLKNGRKSTPGESEDPRSKERVKINGEVHENVSTKGKKGAGGKGTDVKKLKVKKLAPKTRKDRENHETEKGVKRNKRYRHYH